MIAVLSNSFEQMINQCNNQLRQLLTTNKGLCIFGFLFNGNPNMAMMIYCHFNSPKDSPHTTDSACFQPFSIDLV